MTREQLEHVLRAASAIVGERDVLVIGSQAILGTIPDRDLPVEATTSIEADLAFFDDPADEKADRVDGAIGELSPFHEMYGYYAQGVSVTTASCRLAGVSDSSSSSHRTPNPPAAFVSSRTVASSPSSSRAVGRTGTLPARFSENA